MPITPRETNTSRVRQAPTVTDTVYTRYSNGEVTREPTRRTVSPFVCYRKYRYWMNDSDYLSKKRQGTPLPDHPFKYMAVTLECGSTWAGRGPSPSNLLRQDTFVKSEGPLSESIPATWYDSWATVNDLPLTQRLLDKARGEEFNAPVFILEARKTTDMVVQRATQMAMIVRDLRRGRFVDAHDRLFGENKTLSSRALSRKQRDHGIDPTKTASNTWLEWTYGWSPLLSDVHNAFKTFEEVRSREPNQMVSIRASVKAERRAAIPYKSSASPLAQEADRIFLGTRFSEVQSSIRDRWLVKPNPLDLPGKLGLLNPALVAWELVPFSFVVDWFLPVGSYLSQFDVPLRVTHVSRTRGRLEKLRIVREGYADPYNIYGGTNRGTYRLEYNIVRAERTVGLAAPSIPISSLRITPGLNASRATSAIALLRQQIQGLIDRRR